MFQTISTAIIINTVNHTQGIYTIKQHNKQTKSKKKYTYKLRVKIRIKALNYRREISTHASSLANSSDDKQYTPSPTITSSLIMHARQTIPVSSFLKLPLISYSNCIV